MNCTFVVLLACFFALLPTGLTKGYAENRLECVEQIIRIHNSTRTVRADLSFDHYSHIDLKGLCSQIKSGDSFETRSGGRWKRKSGWKKIGEFFTKFYNFLKNLVKSEKTQGVVKTVNFAADSITVLESVGVDFSRKEARISSERTDIRAEFAQLLRNRHLGLEPVFYEFINLITVESATCNDNHVRIEIKVPLIKEVAVEHCHHFGVNKNNSFCACDAILKIILFVILLMF